MQEKQLQSKFGIYEAADIKESTALCRYREQLLSHSFKLKFNVSSSSFSISPAQKISSLDHPTVLPQDPVLYFLPGA